MIDIEQHRNCLATSRKPSNGMSIAGAGDEDDSIDLDALPTRGDVLLLTLTAVAMVVVSVWIFER